MRAEHDVDPRRTASDLTAVLLGEATAHGDLHPGSDGLDRLELAEVAVEAVVGVLAYGAGVEHDDVGLRTLTGTGVASALEQAGKPL